MKNYHYLLVIAIALSFTSCSVTKFVPEGHYLLDDVKIVTDRKEVSSSDLKPYVRQNPNSKWFGLIKTQLHIYNLSGRDSTNGFNKFLRKLGDAPVIYNPEDDKRSQEEITKALHNMGYMSAEVESSVSVRKKKLRLQYDVRSGNPYIVNSIRYVINDNKIRDFMNQDSTNRLISEGMRFDIERLDAERQRITTNLLNNGYYKFHKDYITYQADTIRSTYKVDLTLYLHPYKAFPTDSARNHRQYKINKISFVADQNMLQSADFSRIDINDSIHYKGYPIYYKDKLFLRPKVLTDNLRLTSGGLYSEHDVQRTYTYFGRLPAIRYTNIRFAESNVGDSATLNAYVMLSRSKHQSVTFELEGTNSAGDLGAAASVSYQNRNIFRGSETFTLKFRGAYEAISELQQGYNNDDYKEFGVESSINFPSFLFPFLSTNFKRNIRATTEFGLQYSHQIRPEFTRTVASASWSYKWNQQMQRAQHRFDLIDVNFLYMPWISDDFQNKYLDDNPILQYNYKNRLIVRMGYMYNYNSIGGVLTNNTIADNSYSIRANIESAGNILYGLSRLGGLSKNDDGEYALLNIPFAQYLKADIDYAQNIVFDSRNSLAFHIGAGIAVPYGNAKVIPFEKQYFSGGANSVRGWAVRTLGPGKFEGDDNFLNQSGEIKFDASIELRSKLFWKFQGAFFIDAGNIWTIRDYENQPGGVFKFNEFYKQIAFAYGLGLRFDFDFFILRLDGGMKAVNPVYENRKDRFPIIRPNFSRDFAFHFAVGYPF